MQIFFLHFFSFVEYWKSQNLSHKHKHPLAWRGWFVWDHKSSPPVGQRKVIFLPNFRFFLLPFSFARQFLLDCLYVSIIALSTHANTHRLYHLSCCQRRNGIVYYSAYRWIYLQTLSTTNYLNDVWCIFHLFPNCAGNTKKKTII